MNKAPFGKPFHYTETLQFTSDKKPWWKFWGNKKPVAWLASGRAIDDEGNPKNLGAQAYMTQDGGGDEMKISPIEPTTLTPIFDQDFVEDLIIAVDEGIDFNQ